MVSFLDIGNQIRVAHQAVGSGPDVVLIHGWPLHMGTWRKLVANLPGYRCHLIDLPGFGLSPWNGNTAFDCKTHTDVVHKVLNRLQLKKYALIGHDSGGLIARYVAAERPKEVSALIVAGSEIAGEIPWQIKWVFAPAGQLPLRSLVLKMVLGLAFLRNSPLGFGGTLVAPGLLDRGEFFDLFFAPLLGNASARDHAMRTWRDFDRRSITELSAAHSKIAAPTLLIWGDQCPFFPAQRARAMERQFAGSTRFEVLESAGLYVHEEHPNRFAAMCKDFLDAILANGDAR
jgi:haloalkane dehalogenase